MAETLTNVGADRFEVRVTADSHFGWIRTRLSLERTMMSWLRTATALIGFGFAIVQYLHNMAQASGARAALPDAPRYLGLALIGSGVLALLISIWQYQWGIRYLSSGSFSAVAGVKEGGMRTPVLAVAVLLICIGLFAFFAVLFHLA
jgi:putative membrane protein